MDMIIILLFTSIVVYMLYISIYHFAKNLPSQKAFENGFRILVAISMLYIYILICFLLSIEKIGGNPIDLYRSAFLSFFDKTGYQGLKKVYFLLSLFFVHLGGVGIPLLALFYIINSSRLTIALLSDRINNTKQTKCKQNMLDDMVSVFYAVMKNAGVKGQVTFLVDRNRKYITSWGCHILKWKGRIYLIIGEDLLEQYGSGETNKNEIQAIFSHEVSHICHKDYLLPLWLRYSVYAVYPFPAALSFSVAFLFSAFIKFQGFNTLWKEFLVPSFIVLIVTYCIRAVILEIVAHCMREREYLADARACESGVSREVMISILKKAYIFMIKKSRLIKETVFHNGIPFMDSQNRIGRFMNILKGQVLLHPCIGDRIRALKNSTYFAKKKKITLLPMRDVVISTLLLTTFFLCFGVVIKVFKVISLSNSVLFFIVMIVTPIILSILSCMPLRFLSARELEMAFIPGAPGSQAQSRALLLFASLFYNKYWLKVHRNNFVVVLTAGLLIFYFSLYFSSNFAHIAVFSLPFTLFGCTGICIIYIVTCIDEKYRHEKGVTI